MNCWTLRFYLDIQKMKFEQILNKFENIQNLNLGKLNGKKHFALKNIAKKVSLWRENQLTRDHNGH